MTIRSRALSLFAVMVAVTAGAAALSSRSWHPGFGAFLLDRGISRTGLGEAKSGSTTGSSAPSTYGRSLLIYRPRHTPLDTSGFGALPFVMKPWKPNASLEEINNDVAAGRIQGCGSRRSTTCRRQSS